MDANADDEIDERDALIHVLQEQNAELTARLLRMPVLHTFTTEYTDHGLAICMDDNHIRYIHKREDIDINASHIAHKNKGATDEFIRLLKEAKLHRYQRISILCHSTAMMDINFKEKTYMFHVVGGGYLVTYESALEFLRVCLDASQKK
jgi:hypothetical protein